MFISEFSLYLLEKDVALVDNFFVIDHLHNFSIRQTPPVVHFAIPRQRHHIIFRAADLRHVRIE